MKHINIIAIAAILAFGITDCHEERGNWPGLMLASFEQSPIANAGSDQRVSILKGSVDLDGAKSYDPEGKALSFTWTMTYQPAGSTASFSQPDGVAPSFTFDTAGTYEIMLTVNNGSRSASDTVTVDVAVNSGPTANAGSTQEVTVGDTVTLDGSGSSDPDGDSLVYTWTQIYGPAIGAGTLTGVNPTFMAPAEVCTIAYELRVDDGSGNSFSSRVYIYVMKKGGAGIYVSTTLGNDANAGTDRSAPKKTIQAGVTAALAAKCDVYVGAGTYAESVTLANGVSIFGRFDPATWVRDSFKSSATPSYTTTIQGGTIAIDGNGVKDLLIDGFTITSANAVAAGEGSYALRLINSTVELINCNITAGNGARGETPLTVPNKVGKANNGANGANGIANIANDWYHTSPGGSGGNGGTGNNGGTGGNGGSGDYDGTSGNYGVNNSGIAVSPGGNGGSTGNFTKGDDGDQGSNGAAGAIGSHGAGGSSGIVTGNKWVSYSGLNGGTGSSGNGGGGGGGGGGQMFNFYVFDILTLITCFAWGEGNGGGGGGAGGAAGIGGYGAGGGGASFGIFLIESVVTINTCTIISGNGGEGGTGGVGGEGGDGGNGGPGGAAALDEVGRGGNGGNGGAGGSGGYGGGGAGGPSYVVYKHGASSGFIVINMTGTTLTPGSGGAGGASSGNPGAAGKSGYYGGVQ